MNIELEQTIVKKYSALHRKLRPRWKDAPLFECEDGWRAVIEDLSMQLSPFATVNGLAVIQVKEKFGGLRVHIEFNEHKDDPPAEVWDTVHRLIDEAQKKSACTCEFCGAPGRLAYRKGGPWVRTVCEPCAAAKEYQFTHMIKPRPQIPVWKREQLARADAENEQQNKNNLKL